VNTKTLQINRQKKPETPFTRLLDMRVSNGSTSDLTPCSQHDDDDDDNDDDDDDDDDDEDMSDTGGIYLNVPFPELYTRF
jgi:hypothetical protein